MDFLQVGRQFRKAQTDRWKPEPASGHLTAPRGGFCAKHLAKSFSRGSGTARALSWKDQAVVSKKLHTACYIAQAIPPLIHVGYVYHARLQRARIKALLNHTNYKKKLLIELEQCPRLPGHDARDSETSFGPRSHFDVPYLGFSSTEACAYMIKYLLKRSLAARLLQKVNLHLCDGFIRL